MSNTKFTTRLLYVIIMPIIMGIVGIIIYIPLAIFNWILSGIGYELYWFHSVSSAFLWFAGFGFICGLKELLFPDSDEVFQNEVEVFENKSEVFNNDTE